MYVFMYFTEPVWTDDWMMTGDPLVMTGGGLPGERGWLPQAFPLVLLWSLGNIIGGFLATGGRGRRTIQFNE